MNEDGSTASGSTQVGDELSGTDASAESSFYGDDNLKRQFEDRARSIDTTRHWRVHDWNIDVIAARAVQRELGNRLPDRKRKREAGDVKNSDSNGAKKSKREESDAQGREMALRPPPSKPFNPYEGLDSALKLNEAIDDFLQRVKPSRADSNHPWIWCANFHAEREQVGGSVASFKQVGTKLLENYAVKRHRLESSFDPPKPPGSITRMLGPDRKNLEEDIIRAATKHEITSGKWMLFPTEDKVDSFWSAVVRATVDGRLGTAAKVAVKPEKSEEQEPTRVICVYTRDFKHVADLKRVLMELIRLKLAPAIAGPLQKSAGVKGQIWYKPDCFTYLELFSNNEYKIKPTLYSTSALLTADDVQRLG